MLASLTEELRHMHGGKLKSDRLAELQLVQEAKKKTTVSGFPFLSLDIFGTILKGPCCTFLLLPYFNTMENRALRQKWGLWVRGAVKQHHRGSLSTIILGESPSKKAYSSRNWTALGKFMDFVISGKYLPDRPAFSFC